MVGNVRKQDIQVIFIIPNFDMEYPSVGLLLSCLKQGGYHNVAICAYNSPSLALMTKQFKYTVLAFSTFTCLANEFIGVSRRIKKKKPSIISIFGGPHPTFAPEMITEDGVDGVCIGEAEEALVEFLDRYDYEENQAALDIKNWWIKDRQRRIHKNELRTFVQDLDSLPFYDRSYFCHIKEFKLGLRRFIFSRGCPYECAYCTVPSYLKLYNKNFGSFYRVRSVSNAIEEMKQTLREHGGSLIAIKDSNFGIDRNWLEKYVYHYTREINLPFYCNAEVRFITEDYLNLLKRAGCRAIMLGLETSSGALRRNVLNKWYDDDSLNRAVAMIKTRKIKVGTYNMIGIPEGTLDDDLHTLETNKFYKTDIVQCYVFSFFPGISLYDQYRTRQEHPEKFKVESNVYWHVINDRRIRKDLPQLLRLQVLFDLFAYYKVPTFCVRILIALPLRLLYKVIVFLFVRQKLYFKRMMSEVT